MNQPQLPVDELSAAHHRIARLEAENERLHGQIEHERARVKGLLVDLENANTDLVVKRREVNRLKAKIVKQDTPDAPEQQQLLVFNHWRRVCRNDSPRVVFTTDRREKVRARLKEYPVADLIAAVDGAHLIAYVDDKGKKHDDLFTIMRDGRQVERFRDHAEAHRAGSPIDASDRISIQRPPRAQEPTYASVMDDPRVHHRDPDPPEVYHAKLDELPEEFWEALDRANRGLSYNHDALNVDHLADFYCAIFGALGIGKREGEQDELADAA